MSIIRLLLLSLHKVTYIRSRSAVWFLMTILVPSLICAYWLLALRDNPSLHELYNVKKIITYYVVMLTLYTFLVSHLKGYITHEEIQKGGLSRALLKPCSYYWYSVVFMEFPYRLVQGTYSILFILILRFLFPHVFAIDLMPISFILGIVSCVMGFFICINLELMLGLLAFWFYDMRLMHNAYEVIFIFLTGVNMPIYLFPSFLQQVSFITPLPYVIYIPTLIITNQTSVGNTPVLLLGQLGWLLVTSAFYTIMWRNGIKIFTATGS